MNASTSWVVEPAANFSTRLLPLSVTYTVPSVPTATPLGSLRPVNGSTVCRGVGVGPFDGVVGPGDAVVGAVACGDGCVTLHAVMPMAEAVTTMTSAMTTNIQGLRLPRAAGAGPGMGGGGYPGGRPAPAVVPRSPVGSGRSSSLIAVSSTAPTAPDSTGAPTRVAAHPTPNSSSTGLSGGDYANPPARQAPENRETATPPPRSAAAGIPRGDVSVVRTRTDRRSPTGCSLRPRHRICNGLADVRWGPIWRITPCSSRPSSACRVGFRV